MTAEHTPIRTAHEIAPTEVHDVLREHLLVDGLDLVLDTDKSQGSWLVDARDGTRYLDMFTFFASAPLGFNHPALLADRDFLDELTAVSVNKPSNSDVYTTHLARFVASFQRVLGDASLPHLFLVSGGALAVENALKVAFDWKRRHNAANGRDGDRGRQVLHLAKAFHGRSGYTLSLTNTDPVKTMLFPVFDWPRVGSPGIVFPLEDHLEQVVAAEQAVLADVRRHFEQADHDIACTLIEPIQGEGGDNHFRPEFLQALQALTHEFDALFVVDEVQSGGGVTGTPWAFQQLGIQPDVLAFGKKIQVCGVMAGGRVDEVKDNVFSVSSRINSTWGGNLTDIVRSRKIWDVVGEQDLMANAAAMGTVLLERITQMQDRHAALDNARGRGLLVAVDLPDTATRDAVLTTMFDDEHVILLGCGTRSIRFRPHLAVVEQDVLAACEALDRVLTKGAFA
ncbi:MAG: L-lysine 6-transaminase [Glaciecola sp.]